MMLFTILVGGMAFGAVLWLVEDRALRVAAFGLYLVLVAGVSSTAAPALRFLVAGLALALFVAAISVLIRRHNDA